MGRYGHEGADDQLAILEVRSAVLWEGRGTRVSGGTDHRDVHVLRQDLSLWRKQVASGLDGDDGSLDLLVRLHACCIVVSSVAAGLYEQQRLGSDKPEPDEDKLSTCFTNDMYSCAGDALRGIVAAWIAALSGTRAFRLTRPLYIVTTALEEELSRIRSKKNQWHRDLLASQASCATDWLQQIAHKFGDRLSLGILKEQEVRRPR